MGQKCGSSASNSRTQQDNSNSFLAKRYNKLYSIQSFQSAESHIYTFDIKKGISQKDFSLCVVCHNPSELFHSLSNLFTFRAAVSFLRRHFIEESVQALMFLAAKTNVTNAISSLFKSK